MTSQSGPQSATESFQSHKPGGTHRVGMIGLGVMGRPMALNLLRHSPGSTVTVSGRSRGRLQAVLDAGALWAPTARAVAAASEVIVLMVPDLSEVELLLAGPDGRLAGVSGPTVLVIGSTSSPEELRALGARVREETRGLLRLVDAPVSGGEDGAIAGTLSIMVGGDDADVSQALAVLETMGTPVHLGPLGSGAVAKLCNQLIVAATIMAIGEAAVIAERAGLDLAQLFELLEGGYAGSRVLATRKQRIVESDYSPSGAAKYMVKDLTYASREAAQTATTAPQLTALLTAFSDLTERGFGDNDIAVTRAYVESLGSARAHDTSAPPREPDPTTEE